MKLQGKVALITGGGSGIGRAIALRFATEGARIVVADLNAETGAETAALVREAGADALAVATDVSRSSEVAALFRTADDEGFSPDIVVNNAGNAGTMKPVHEVSDEAWDAIVDVHLKGTFYGTREALKRMVPKRSGVIINVGSVAGLAGLAFAASYAAAKGGIIAFTKSVALEVAKHGVRVNCVAPGFTETPILQSLSDKLRAVTVSRTPLGRIGLPEEIASVALFFASADSTYVIGQVLSPNGGIYT